MVPKIVEPLASKSRYKGNGNGTAADGQQMHFEFDANFDGKEYPLIGVTWADTLSAQWIDAETPQIIEKRDGQVTMMITCTVSRNKRHAHAR